MGMLNRHLFKNHKPGTRVRCGCDTGPGLTKQEFAKESDMNYIVARYHSTGQLPAGAQEAIFADVSNIGDFAEMQRSVKSAEAAFASLPANVRSRFKNRPGDLIDFIQDGRNRDEAISLGLIAKKEELAPTPKEPPAPPKP